MHTAMLVPLVTSLLLFGAGGRDDQRMTPTLGGRLLAEVLDGAIDQAPAGRAGYVMTVCKMLGLPIHVPEGKDPAGAIVDWLESPDAKKAGWQRGPVITGAQTLANDGLLVVIASKAKGPGGTSYLVIVRPTERRFADVRKNGPTVMRPELRSSGTFNVDCKHSQEVTAKTVRLYVRDVRRGR